MKQLYVALSFIIFVMSASAEPPAIPFTIPPGYVVEKVAGPPLVEHPMFACFDDRGRLYVADSGGKNLKAEDLLKELPSRIVRLEDSNGDGVFDKYTVFADKMSFPMGVLWHEGHVYSCSPPSLWRLTDTNGDGVADRRTELVSKFGFIGNAADIHGPWRGPDGWLYWTDGRHGHEIRKPDGTIQTKGKAARIFRCKVDGSNVEVVCGGGMDDPVQMAFTEEGEPFAVVDIFKARPTRVDALIYCIDGGVFPYYEAVLNEFKRTGPLLPAVSELGWVAPSGLIRYRSDHLGREFTDTMLSTQFNTHKVVRHTLTRAGAGFTSKDEEFITSSNPDFHPTSLVEDADGSLLVIDTGGWFRIGCPTSQVAKPEIKGGIYRVRRKDAPKVADPRGEKIEWGYAQLPNAVKLLNDPRFVVRDRAVAEFAKLKEDFALQYLAQASLNDETPRAHINALWALSRMGTDKSHQHLAECLAKDPRPSARLVAARALGLSPRAGTRQALWNAMIGEKDAAVLREAAIGLARCRGADARNVLPALSHSNDPFLAHAIIHAIIESGDVDHLRSYLKYSLPEKYAAELRAGLIALHQMPGANLQPADVLPSLLDPDRALQQTAWEIALKQAGWFSEISALLRKQLQGELPPERRELLRDALAAACHSLNVELFIAETLNDNSTSASGRLLLLDVVASADAAKPPPTLVTALKSQLRRSEPAVVRQTIRAIQARGTSDCDDALEAVVKTESLPTDIRLSALAVVAARLKELPKPLFDFTLARWADDPRTAAQILGTAKLSEVQVLGVCGIVSSASALELPRLLDAFRQSSSEKIGHDLIAALGKAPALASVAPGDLRSALAKFPAEVRTAAEPLFKKLAVDETAQRQKLSELAGIWAKGDVERGRNVFFGRKALCSACHAVRGDGERIGPELSKIGSMRTEADLLESVIFPSNSIARGYESVTVHTKDGRSQSGLVRRETADALHLVTTDRTELRFARTSIETIEPSRTSIMPLGLEAQLSRQELGDLIAFLRSLK